MSESRDAMYLSFMSFKCTAIAEMITPEVNKELLAELEFMGFSVARSTRALHFSGSTAVNCP
jgi:hypothetical protein